MRIDLLGLSDGRLSLKINSAERRRVAARIKDLFGVIEIFSLSTGISRFVFAGEEFLFHDERNDPCLISRSDRGDAILKQLAAALA